MRSHDAALVPLIKSFEVFFDSLKSRKFKLPKKIKRQKKKKPITVEYRPKNAPKPPPNSPIILESTVRRAAVGITNFVTVAAQANAPKRDDQAQIKLRIRLDKLWRMLRVFCKFHWFPRFWYQREYDKIFKAKEIIKKFLHKNFALFKAELDRVGLRIVENSMFGVWYESSSMVIIFDQTVLDNYFLDNEAADENTFFLYTKDRIENIQVFLK